MTEAKRGVQCFRRQYVVIDGEDPIPNSKTRVSYPNIRRFAVVPTIEQFYEAAFLQQRLADTSVKIVLNRYICLVVVFVQSQQPVCGHICNTKCS